MEPRRPRLCRFSSFRVIIAHEHFGCSIQNDTLPDGDLGVPACIAVLDRRHRTESKTLNKRENSAKFPPNILSDAT
jgi:hypothetical protein